MRITVVIPAFEEEGRVADAVRSAQGPDIDVVVVDGGSRDATLERARAAGAETRRAEPGRARQLQTGAEDAAGEAVVFLHADTRLPPGWADAVRGCLADPGVAGGAFGLRFQEAGARLRFIELGVRLRVALFGMPYGDQALFVRRSVLEKVGGVPQAPIMEDLDLARATRRHGRLVVLPDEVVTAARRYAGRPLLHMLRNWAALLAWRCGLDRRRVAAWYAR